MRQSKEWRVQDFPERVPIPEVVVKTYYYRPQRSWGKVIFAQASVILLTGGDMRGCSQGGHAWLLPGGHAWLF